MASKFSHTSVLFILAVAFAAPSVAPRAQQRHAQTRAQGKALILLDSTRERDGLRGPVRRVRTEVARLTQGSNARIIEGPRRLLEVTVYDTTGRRIENATYPVINSPVGAETNIFDERGQLTETTLRDLNGSIINRTIYSYEFDRHGNWTKMTASLAVVGPSGPSFEPVEVTYRSISYFAPTPPASAVADGAAAQTLSSEGNSSSRATSITPAAERANANPSPEPSRTDASSEEFSSLPDAGLLNDKASSLPPPAFPVGKRATRGLILVVVEVIVDEAGRVTQARAPSGPEALREAAEEAARNAVFAPFRTSGKPRSVRGTIRYTFPYEP